MSDLRRFLGRAPDGRELYRYRVSDEQYAQLRRFLRHELRTRGLRYASRELHALFCVFSAEWWRREHEQGPWSWKGITEAVGVGGEPYEAVEIAVDRGLRLLGRPLLRSRLGHRQRLVTVACEGGLPLRRLAVEGARLRAYLRDVLEHLEALGMTGQEEAERLCDIAERHDHRLPVSLRREIVHRLVGEMAGRAWALRRELPPDTADPVAVLDRIRPEWREHLPLVVSDDSAEALLRGLMRDVARVASGRGTRVRMLACLTLHGTTAALSRFLDLPRTVTDAQLARVFRDQALPAGSRVQLRLRAEGGDTVRCGVLSRLGDGAWTCQPVAGAELVGREAARAVSVLAATRAGTIEAATVEGSGPLGPLPWVFRRSAGQRARWDLVASGSARRREPELWVALPDGATAEGDYAPDPRTVLGRALVRAVGAVRVATDAGLVRVVAGSDRSDTATYELRGRRFDRVVTSRTTWLGLPTLVRRLGEREEPVPVELQDGGRWRAVRAGDVGELQLRARVDGVAVYRGCVRVVPEDLWLDPRIGDGVSPGAWVIESRALIDVGVPEDPRWRAEKSGQGGRFQIELSALGEVPGRVPLTLEFAHGLFLGEVPFPQRTLHFEDADGCVLAPGMELHVKRLGGIRAVGMSPDPSARFAVTLQPRGLGPGDPAPCGCTFQLEAQPTREQVLDLRDVQTAALGMLDATERLDAFVRIRLFEIGGSTREVSISTRRYDWTFAMDDEAGEVLLVGPGHEELGEVVVEARPFADIARVERLPQRAVDRHAPPRWVFDRSLYEQCTWLITAREGSWYRCRPVPRRGSGPVVELTGLRAAFELPSEDLRHECIRSLLHEMSAHWSHPDWEVVDAFLDLAGNLPVATFDLFRVLSRHTHAAAVVAVRAAGSDAGRLVQILDGLEELVFLWEAVPFQAWWDTFDRLVEAFPAAHEGYAINEVFARGNALGKELPFVLVPLHHWARARGYEVAGEPDPQLPVCMTFVSGAASALLLPRQDAVQDFLRRRSSEQSWPAPPPGTSLSDPGSLAVAEPHLDAHRRRVLDAPAVLACAATGEAVLSAGETLFLEEVRAFDEDYFRECFLFSYFAGVAWRFGDP